MSKSIVRVTAVRVTTYVVAMVVGLCAVQSAQAEVNVRLRAGVGIGQYSVDSNFSIGGGGQYKVEYEADYITVPVGVTLIFDNELYVDMVHQSSSGDAKFSFSNQKPDFSRDDTTLTIGGRLDNVSIYVGYKTSEAITDWPSGTGIAPDRLTTSGFLAGVGWAIPLSSSAFNLGAGVGVLSGVYDYSSTAAPLDSETTLGYSLNAGYTYVFGPSFSVNADLRYQSYDYKFDSFFIKESPAHLVVSASYAF
ncbi:MAG TPA: hypothetical protein VK629_05965 [Steroidobacteraceae bacterium]|nr:hypothetical protein [Steroidobacteraceae bacterium]